MAHFFSHMGAPPPVDPRMMQLERAFPTNCLEIAFQEFARTALNWPDLFDSIASLIERRLRTSFDEPKLAALYTLDYMVKQVVGNGRPFARIFAISPALSLRDIVCQFYRDVLHRQAQFPQSRDLASKMDKMYQVWWEYLLVFVEQPAGPPFIDGKVLRDIATYCVSVRPQLRPIADEMSRRIEASQLRLGLIPRPQVLPPAPPVVATRQLTTAEKIERINKFCDSFSRLFSSELSMNSMTVKDVRRCLVEHLQRLDPLSQAKMHAIINDSAERGLSDSDKGRLKTFWDIIDSWYKQQVVQKLYDDTQGVRRCEVCGTRFDPVRMQMHMQRHRREEHDTFSKTRPWFLKREDFEAGVDLKQAKKAAEAAAGGGLASPTSPVATTPKIALERSVHVRELKCALCGGPFDDTHIEIVSGQSFLLHSVPWATPADDDSSPRSPMDDSTASSDGAVAGPQFAHSSCAQNIAQ